MSNLKLKQLGSVLLTFAIFTWLMGWQIGLLLVVGIGFHELSHLWAAKRLGFKTQGFFLIPFVGGLALYSGRYKNYFQQAVIAIAGPVGGGLLAGVTAAIYYLTGQPFFLLAAYWMTYINLFNLLPFSFMDGGQLLTTITYSLNRTLGIVCYILSTLIGVAILWFLFSPTIAIFIGLFGGYAVIKEIKNWHYYRTGREWLVEDTYLNHPKSLTKLSMTLTIVGWGVAAALLAGLLSVLTTSMNHLNVLN